MACAGLLRARHTLVLRDHPLEWTCRVGSGAPVPLRQDFSKLARRAHAVRSAQSTAWAKSPARGKHIAMPNGDFAHPTLRHKTMLSDRPCRGPIEAISVKRACGDTFRMHFGEARHAERAQVTWRQSRARRRSPPHACFPSWRLPSPSRFSPWEMVRVLGKTVRLRDNAEDHSRALATNLRKYARITRKLCHYPRLEGKLSLESQRGILDPASISVGQCSCKWDFSQFNHCSGSWFTIVTNASHNTLGAALSMSSPTFAKSRR